MKNFHRFYRHVLCAVMIAVMTFVSTPGADASPPMSREKGASLVAGDPVVMSTGKFTFNKELLNLGGVLPLTAEMIYYTKEAGVKNDEGIYFNFQSFIEPWTWMTRPTVEILLGHLQQTLQFYFDAASGKWKLLSDTRASRGYVLKDSETFYYLSDPIDEKVYAFEKYKFSNNMAYGRLKYVFDRNNNRLTFTYEGTEDRIPNGIYENDGGPDCRKIRIQSSAGHVRSVTERLTINGQEQDGRTVLLEYGETCGAAWKEVLCSLTDADGKITRFTWDMPWVNVDAVIKSITYPNGNTPYTLENKTLKFDGFSENVVVSQTDAYSNKTTFDYSDWLNKVTETRPDGTTVQYQHWGKYETPQKLTDATGKTAYFGQYGPKNQLTYITDRLGDNTTFTYHAETGKIASVKNAQGNTVSYTYTAQDQTFKNPANNEEVTFTFYNLTQMDYPDGTKTQLTYDQAGNIISRTDRNGKVWEYTYNAKGQVLTEKNPAGGMITWEYNPDGTLASKTDSDTGKTTYQYDVHKRIAQITYPDGSTYKISYNANDVITQITDQKGVVTKFDYDNNQNLIGEKRAFGTSIEQSFAYQYDLMDRMIKFTDPAGKSTQYEYTYWGAIKQITWPDTAQVKFGYDARQWLMEVTDEAGKTLTASRDDEAIFTGLKSPANRQLGLGSDKLGYYTQMTDPAGNLYKIERNAMEQIVKVIDPLNRETTITRDGEGRITSITLPVIGTVTYTRNELGLVSRMTDQRGKNWDFDYTPMGRLKTIKDPLNNVWTYAYDTMGRLQTITYPDQQTETRTYDANGNLIKREFTGGLTLTYTYDDLNRMTATGSAAVNLTYDTRNNITNTQIHNANFSAAYDDRNRMQTAGYDGQMTVTYTYDPRGLVSRVTDSITNAWIQFTYDDDRLLIKIERSNGVATNIERDGLGRIKTLTHGTKGKLEFTYNLANEITQIIEDLPVDVKSFLVSELKEYTYDDANQTNAAGFSYDKRGRRLRDPDRVYTWDSADRLTGVTKGETSVTYEYTASGEVAKRTVNGVTTEYFYNYAIKGHPIMAERKNSAFTRFYVYTPEGRLLYFVDLPNTPIFYHFNHLGTTLFLTNSAGNISDSYGYTPYGRMVKHEGTSDQPFTYVGEHGVRQEGDTGLYHMRARYYDALTARFLSRDPAWNYENDPKSANPYPYAGQNPLSFIDPAGLDYYISAFGERISDDEIMFLPSGAIIGRVSDSGQGQIIWGVRYYYEKKNIGLVNAKLTFETVERLHLPRHINKLKNWRDTVPKSNREILEKRIGSKRHLIFSSVSVSDIEFNCDENLWYAYPNEIKLIKNSEDGFINIRSWGLPLVLILMMWLCLRIGAIRYGGRN